ncbi:MAG: L,D-transpeptidase family protein [Actinomycetota bacterium]|nr:L,D-transpeptidase family protein [Actinomycetota bacterium]
MRRSSAMLLAASLLLTVPAYAQPAIAAEPQPSPPAAEPAPPPPPAPGAAPAGQQQADDPIRSQPEVQAAEEQLKRLGLPGGKVDGKQTRSTRRALCAFRERSIPSWRAAAPASPGPTSTPWPRWRNCRARSQKAAVSINERCQVIYVVKGGKYVHVGAASTGGKDGATPNGRHQIEWRWPGWHESSAVENGHMYNATYFAAGGYAIHGSRFPIRPYPTSHGCVRVKRATADLVLELPLGTPVTVRGRY